MLVKQHETDWCTWLMVIVHVYRDMAMTPTAMHLQSLPRVPPPAAMLTPPAQVGPCGWWQSGLPEVGAAAASPQSLQRTAWHAPTLWR